MSELRKANTESAYFLTLTVVGWIDVFTRKEYCEIVLKNLRYCQENKGLEVFAFVIMPSHIHMVARRKEDLLSELLRDFKSVCAKEIIKAIKESKLESRQAWMLYLFRYYAKESKQNKEYMFWQKTSHPIELFSNSVIDQKIDYIHKNPIEAGIVTEEAGYWYSSANPFVGLQTYEA